MKNFESRSWLDQWLRTIAMLVGLAISQGCVSPIALDYAVMAYDQTTTEIQSKQLLLNIARAHQHQPLHFTGVSNIAATFNFQFNAGATPAFTGESGSLMTPIFGGTVSENPTISIVPMEGEEFTRRLLTPLQENKLTMLLRQGADVDLILRLLAGELRVSGAKRESVYNNRPKDARGYRYFRQIVAHLSSIQDRRALFIEPLLFEKAWRLSKESMPADRLIELQQDFDIDHDIRKNEYLIKKKVTGHIILTNYDPQQLSNEERIALNEEADQGAFNDVMVDIRPEFPGGELPVHGFFRLRSFYNILNFIGRDIEDEPEIDIEINPKTPHVYENPTHTLAIIASEEEPDGADITVKYGDKYYAVMPESDYPWNREGFRLLHQVFQMTMSELPRQGVPSITISK
ncbi:hypothetical protein [Methylomonas sp. MgM2]